MLLIIFTLVFLVWVYILWVRDWLLKRLAGTKYDRYHQQIRKLWGASRTMLVGRLYWLVGILMGLHELAIQAGFDFTPILREIANLLPEKFRPLALALLLYATGLVIIKLRKVTGQDYEEKVEQIGEK
jgi:hypothetical protein